MPMYEFQCRDCESTFDDLVGADAIETISCGRCGSPDVVRLYSPFAVHAAAPVAAVTAGGGSCMPGPARSGGGGGCCGGGCGGCG